METTFNTKMAAIEKKVKDTFTNIATTITDKLKTASTDTSTKLGEIETTFSTKMAAAEKSTKDAMTNIASYVESNMKKASESVTTYCDSIASTVDTKMKAATSSIDTESGKWKTTVDTAIKNVQNLFSGNFSWGVPELKIPVKLPKYKVDGKWEFDDDGNITKTPKITVEWYRRAAEMGALFNSPTVVGVGDATQPELLIGEDTLYDKIRQAVGENAGEFNQTLNFYQSGDSDPAETARLVRNNTRILLNRMRGGV